MDNENIQDYIKGRMKASDLKKAGNRYAAMSDEEIDRLIEDSDDTSSYMDKYAEPLRTRLLDEIAPQKPQPRRFSFTRLITVAAAVMIPLLAISTVYLFVRTNDFAKYEDTLEREIVVSTDKGESTKTVLPDGTEVSLGPESRIAYRLVSFNSAERIVDFEGEASFEVAKDASAPFTVDARDFYIHVLGTGFSVMSREDLDESQIYLDHGSIEVQAAYSDENIVMEAGQSAVINASGNITLYSANDAPRITVGSNAMFFSSASLSDIAHMIERYYGCSVIIAGGLDHLHFTGMLPTDNLMQAKYTLRRALGITISVNNDDQLVFSPME